HKWVTHMSMHRTALVAFLAFTTFAQRATSASNAPRSPQAAEARSAPERLTFDYETSPNERAVVHVVALRAGSTWTVFMLDGSEPTVEKRSAPIGLIFQSLRPKGYHRESFAGRKPQPLDAAHIAQLKTFVETSMQ